MEQAVVEGHEQILLNNFKISSELSLLRLLINQRSYIKLFFYSASVFGPKPHSPTNGS